MAEYLADVVEHVNEVITDWRRAWREDDADAAADLYFEDARIAFPGRDPIVGAEAIFSFFSRELPRFGEIRTTMVDFDASGRMGYVSGDFVLQVDGAEGRMETVTGVYVTVILRRQRTWKIRSQVFTAAPPS